MNFKFKDRVWCIIFGWGTVVDVSPIDNGDPYPIEVLFDMDFSHYYTRDGQSHIHGNRSLYKQEMKVVKK